MKTQMSAHYGHRGETPYGQRERRTSIYRSWEAMKRRCASLKFHGWRHYIGKGIGYQPEWEQFGAFFWDMRESHFDGAELHRQNPALWYSKGNCVWVTKRQHVLLHCDVKELRRRGSRGASKRWTSR